MLPVLVVIVAVALVIVLGAWWNARRRQADGVDSFRRQIDALSPQARRSTVEQFNPDASRSPAPTDAPDDRHEPRDGNDG